MEALAPDNLPEERGGVGRGERRWVRLFAAEGPEAALREVAGWFDRTSPLELVLEAPAGRLARYVASPARPATAWAEAMAPVGGDPPWRLRVRSGASRDETERLALRAAEGLEAWRSFRAERSVLLRRLDGRTKELVLFEAIGHAAAEARGPEGLLASVAKLLHERAGAQAVAVLHGLEGRPRVDAFVAEGVREGELSRLFGRASGIPGWSAGADPQLVVHRLGEGRDLEPPSRFGLPLRARLSRRGRTVAVLAVVFPEPDGPALRRVVQVAARELSLHLDRILTVRESEQVRFRAILDSMPQAVLLADSNLGVLEANLAARVWLERAEKAAAGGRLDRVGDVSLEPLARAALAGAPASALARLEDGSRIAVSVSASRAGSPGELVLVLSDVTAEHRIEERLAQAEKLSSLGRMISGVAHELNNPLTAILGHSELALAERDPEAFARRARILHDEARRCQRIVQTLLRYARRQEPQRRPVRLEEVIESVSALLGFQLRTEGISLRTDIAPDLPAIRADAHELQQALVNLLLNAQQAIREAGKGGLVTIRATRGPVGGVVLEVEDDGPGVPEAIRPRIFDPFFTTKSAGTGLGLWLVYGTVVAHEGSIRVESGRDGGARFRIELPEADREPPAREASPPAESRLLGPAGSPHGRILVVEPSEPVAVFLCEVLSAEGHLCSFESSLERAAERVAREEFDLLICDAGSDGQRRQEVLGALEGAHPGVAAKVVWTATGELPSDDARDAVLRKPFDAEDVRRSVRSFLGRAV